MNQLRRWLIRRLGGYTAHDVASLRIALVELVLDRSPHRDDLFGTEIVWRWKGDIQPVPIALWPLFSRHPDVYALRGLTDEGAETPTPGGMRRWRELHLKEHPELAE